MKRIIVAISIIAVSLLTSCSTPAKLINTATDVKVKTAVIADLEVSSEKISHFYIPSKTVRVAGLDNVIKSAISDALINNGNADVLVALEYQVKYNGDGEVETILITGYPAKYKNFRSPSEEQMTNVSSQQTDNNTANPILGKFKF